MEKAPIGVTNCEYRDESVNLLSLRRIIRQLVAVGYLGFSMVACGGPGPGDVGSTGRLTPNDCGGWSYLFNQDDFSCIPDSPVGIISVDPLQGSWGDSCYYVSEVNPGPDGATCSGYTSYFAPNSK